MNWIIKAFAKKRLSSFLSGERSKRLVFFMFLLPLGALAQTAETDTSSDGLLLIVGALILITIILMLIVAFTMLRVLNVVVLKQAEERAAREGKAYVPEASMWDKFWDSMNASVPVANEKNIDMGHDYDGIRELDNHLPPWWKGLLYLTIIWSVFYLIAYHVSFSLPLSGQEYESELAQAETAKRALLASQPAAVIDENALVYDANAEFITKGKAVFTGSNCQSCHRDDGGGNGVGPNLTDDYWIHGGSIKEIFSTVNKGVVEKGMPAWGKVMSPSDVRDVVFYVMSLQGTNPPNAKAPQGNKYVPVESAPKVDTVKTSASM